MSNSKKEQKLDWHQTAKVDDLPDNRVKTPDNLEQAIRRGLESKQPAIVEIITDPKLI
ncbi:MAG: hypothetical protein H8E14_07195 [Candidatus Marinimicrobia bacterium]|nr:hypothetical protein [Candidatus Neomarinimicrobiota bacterium]